MAELTGHDGQTSPANVSSEPTLVNNDKQSLSVAGNEQETLSNSSNMAGDRYASAGLDLSSGQVGGGQYGGQSLTGTSELSYSSPSTSYVPDYSPSSGYGNPGLPPSVTVPSPPLIPSHYLQDLPPPQQPPVQTPQQQPIHCSDGILYPQDFTSTPNTGDNQGVVAESIRLPDNLIDVSSSGCV